MKRANEDNVNVNQVEDGTQGSTVCIDAILKYWCNLVAGAFWLSIRLTINNNNNKNKKMNQIFVHTKPSQAKPRPRPCNVMHTHIQVCCKYCICECWEMSKCISQEKEKRSDRARLWMIRRHTHALNNEKNGLSLRGFYIAVGWVRFRVDLWLSQQRQRSFSSCMAISLRFDFWQFCQRSCVALLSISSKLRLLNRFPH